MQACLISLRWLEGVDQIPCFFIVEPEFIVTELGMLCHRHQVILTHWSSFSSLQRTELANLISGDGGYVCGTGPIGPALGRLGRFWRGYRVTWLHLRTARRILVILGNFFFRARKDQYMANNHSDTEKRLWDAADEFRANSDFKSSEAIGVM